MWKDEWTFASTQNWSTFVPSFDAFGYTSLELITAVFIPFAQKSIRVPFLCSTISMDQKSIKFSEFILRQQQKNEWNFSDEEGKTNFRSASIHKKIEMWQLGSLRRIMIRSYYEPDKITFMSDCLNVEALRNIHGAMHASASFTCLAVHRMVDAGCTIRNLSESTALNSHFNLCVARNSVTFHFS